MISEQVVANPAIGLTRDEARRRLEQDGANTIIDVEQNALLHALKKLWAPVPWMLEAAILLQLFLGDYVEAGVVALVFSGQAVLYVSRERQHLWSSAPSRWLVASSVLDIMILSVLAINGILMTSLPIGILCGVFAAALLLAFVLDTVKLALFRHLAVA